MQQQILISIDTGAMLGSQMNSNGGAYTQLNKTAHCSESLSAGHFLRISRGTVFLYQLKGPLSQGI